LIDSIFGIIEVKHIPIEAKSRPAAKAKGMRSRDEGSATTPKRTRIGSMRDAEMRLLVAPQRISPAITSSIETGVATMASKVFW